jgi:hypothetical protein
VQTRPDVSILVGCLAGMGVCSVGEVLPDHGIVLMSVTASSAVVCGIGGMKIPLAGRTFVTFLVFYWGMTTCLVGRTMEPRLTVDNVKWAAFLFVVYGSIPCLALFRIWRGDVRKVIVAAVFPVCFVVACGVAGFEEFWFVQQHQEGIGPTSRWTVSNQWLAYDAGTKTLSGSD